MARGHMLAEVLFANLFFKHVFTQTKNKALTLAHSDSEQCFFPVD